MDASHLAAGQPGLGAGGEEPFGSLLRRMRERAGLTQEQLAERAGISTNAVSSLERGARRSPYRHTRDALADALNLTDDERGGFDAVSTRRRPASRLPDAPSPIVGREGDVAAAAALFASRRLVTLTGPGGVGKSRLALEIAEQLRPRYPDGAVFVSLAALSDSADVLPAIADSLGLRELGTRDVREVLAGQLKSRRLLLVLDNFEHVLPAAADLPALLAASPDLAVLVTSRAALRIQSEQLYPVSVLDPAAAERLFLERAGQATGTPVTADPRAVAGICARLDHLPLAIELAAARIRLLSPRQLLSRLDAGLPTLTEGPTDAPERHRTLRSTVEWSYRLLDPGARLLLRQLSSFAGGWTLHAASAIGELDDAVALDLHQALLDNSLIVRDAASEEPRFAFLQTIRAFAMEELVSAGESETTLDRHARFYRDVAVSAGERLWTRNQPQVLDRLESDHENIRSALRRLLALGRYDELADAGFGLWLFYVIRGHLRDPLAWADAAISRGAGLSAATRAKLQFVAGWMLLPRGHYDHAIERFADAADATGDIVDSSIRCWTLMSWSFAEVYRGQSESAADLLQQTMTLADRLGDIHVHSCALIGLSHVSIASGHMREADELLTAALPDIEARGPEWPLAVALGVLGRLATVLGEHDRADHLLRRSVRTFTQLRDTWGMAHQLTHIADAAALAGNHEQAAVLYGGIDILAEDTGAQIFPVWQQLSDDCRQTAAETLGSETYARLTQRGRLLTPDDIFMLADDIVASPTADPAR